MLVELPPFPPPQHRIYLDVIYGSAAGASSVQTRLMCEVMGVVAPACQYPRSAGLYLFPVAKKQKVVKVESPP